MLKRLRGSTGEIADSTSTRPGDTADKIVRSVILVHSGPGGSVNTLASSDGDIEFDAERIQRVVTNHNAMITKLALQYGGFDKMPIGAYPPILDQHADDSNDRIRGRLTGLLRFEKRNVPKVGDNVACALCDPTFLGSDTVAQVLDGRIYHLSVGIDESTDTLVETSTVIEPAAPGAMILSKRKSKLKGKPKMSKKNLAKLQALSAELKGLSTKATAHKGAARLAKRKLEVSGRFTKLMADKKMTPAEFKKLDLVRLSKLQKEDFESVMHVYDARETQIKSGQQGTTSAAVFSDVGTKSAEDREVMRLKASVKKNLKKSGMKFKDEDETKHLSTPDVNGTSAQLAADVNLEQNNLDQSEDGTAETQDREEMMQQIEENATQIARVASMVEGIIKEMSGDDQNSEVDDGDEDNKEMSAESDDKKDDDKKEDDKKDDKKDLDKLDEEKDKKEESK